MSLEVLERIEARLVLGGSLTRVEPAELDAWARLELASVVEGCFGDRLDPEALSPEDREAWVDRLGGTYLPPELFGSEGMTLHLWLCDEQGARVGTIALPRVLPPEARRVFVFSLYVRPAARGRGLASRALEAVYDAALAVGRDGLELETHWPWPRAVSFYLRRRMWLVGWDHHLVFARLRDRDSWELEETDGELRLRLEGRVIASARRAGDLLLSFGGEDDIGRRTLALCMAERRWPLVRSPGAWSDRRRPGAVEGMAEHVLRSEAEARELGWRVETPAIPGLR